MKLLLLPLVLLAACDSKPVKVVVFTPDDMRIIVSACVQAGGYIEQTSTKADHPYRVICTAAPPSEKAKVELEHIVPPAK